MSFSSLLGIDAGGRIVCLCMFPRTSAQGHSSVCLLGRIGPPRDPVSLSFYDDSCGKLIQVFSSDVMESLNLFPQLSPKNSVFDSTLGVEKGPLKLQKVTQRDATKHKKLEYGTFDSTHPYTFTQHPYNIRVSFCVLFQLTCSFLSFQRCPPPTRDISSLLQDLFKRQDYIATSIPHHPHSNL